MLAEMVNKNTKSQNSNEDQGAHSVDDPATVSELWKAQAKRTQFAMQMLNAWAATKVRTETGREMDVLLMPCTPWPASPK